jgi:hypothetical protein
MMRPNMSKVIQTMSGWVEVEEDKSLAGFSHRRLAGAETGSFKPKMMLDRARLGRLPAGGACFDVSGSIYYVLTGRWLLNVSPSHAT